ncbi:DNA-binding domain-containing protein, partial [Gammaproteobacteria bacterium]|nr:DNA-binding domain-containing protein [Gammaproteobacteria bacterium]
MSHLRDLQLRFQDYLINGSEAIEEDIISTENALAQHRLGTYYNAYRIRLIDSLAMDFSALEQYLGRESFESMTLDYLLQYPSTLPSVRWFGQHLPEYLAHNNDAEDAQFVYELAQY